MGQVPPTCSGLGPATLMPQSVAIPCVVLLGPLITFPQPESSRIPWHVTQEPAAPVDRRALPSR